MNKLCYCLLSFAVALTTMLASISCGEDEKENNSIVDEVSYSIIGTWKPVKCVYKDGTGWVQNVISDESELLSKYPVYNFGDDGIWSEYYGDDLNSLVFDKNNYQFGKFYIELLRLTLKKEKGESENWIIKFIDNDTFELHNSNSGNSGTAFITYERITKFNVTVKEILTRKVNITNLRKIENGDGTIKIAFSINANVRVSDCWVMYGRDVVYSFYENNERFKDTNRDYDRDIPSEKEYNIDVESCNLPNNEYTLSIKAGGEVLFQEVVK